MDNTPQNTQTPSRDEFKQKLRQIMEGKIEQIAHLLIDCEDENFFGQTEFDLRDLVHEIARDATQQALEERKKTKQNPDVQNVRPASSP